MNLKTNYYGVFYKQRGKWTKSPAHGAMYTKKDIIDITGLNHRRPFHVHSRMFLKTIRSHFRKPVKLLQQTWNN